MVLPYYLVIQVHPKISVFVSLNRPALHDSAREAGNFTNLAIAILKQNYGLIYMEEREK